MWDFRRVEDADEYICDISEYIALSGSKFSEIHEGSAKEYAKEIVEGLPHMAPEKRRIIKRILTVVLAAAFVLAAYFTSDYYFMQIGGFNY